MNKGLNKNLSYDLDAAIFTATLVLGIGLLTLVSEIGFSPSYYTVFIICGLGLLFATFPLAYKLLFNSIDRIGIDSVLTILLLLFILLISFLPTSVTGILAFILSSSGFVLLLFLIVRVNRKSIISKIFIWIVCPVLLVIWIVGFLYASGIHHPLFFAKISMGVIHRDLLFHSSITEMIRTYGVPSTGLYGTPYVPYHFGSHLLLAKFSSFLGISALEAYNFIFPILFIPLYFLVQLFLIKDLVQIVYKNSSALYSDWLFWGFFIAAAVNILPNNFLGGNWAIWESWVVSESYLISLIFLFLSCSVFLSILKAEKRILELTFSVLLFIVLIFTGLSKISVILVAAGAFLYVIVRSGKWRSPIISLNGIVLIVIVVIGMKTISAKNASQINDNFYPLHFVKVWTDENWRSLFVLMFYFFLIVYTLIRLNSSKIKNFEGLKTAFLAKKLLDVEFLLIAALVGFSPVVFFLIEGGSAYYFIDVQTRITLAFLLAWILNKRSQDFVNLENQNSLGSFLRKNAFAVTVALLFFLNNVFSNFEAFMNANLQLRLSMIKLDPSQSKYNGDYKNVYHYFSGNSDLIMEKVEEITYLPAQILYGNTRYKYYTWLRDTCQQIKEKDHYLLNLSKSSPFWTNGHVRPEMAPFIFPALTGMALANGLPDNFRDIGEYGYPAYEDLKIDTIGCYNKFNKQILLLNPYEHRIDRCR